IVVLPVGLYVPRTLNVPPTPLVNVTLPAPPMLDAPRKSRFALLNVRVVGPDALYAPASPSAPAPSTSFTPTLRVPPVTFTRPLFANVPPVTVLAPAVLSVPVPVTPNAPAV